MDISNGSKTVIQEVVDTVVGKINDYIATANNGGVGTVWSGQSTGVSWGGTKSDITDFNTQKSAEFLKTKNTHAATARTSPPTAESTYQFITECMWNACRLYSQSYTYYQQRGYTNTRDYPPQITETYRGFHGAAAFGELSLEQYQAKSEAQCPEMESGKLMTAQPVNALINSLLDFNKAMEDAHYVNHGLRNTCYSSCHSSCHGSSRGRR